MPETRTSSSHPAGLNGKRPRGPNTLVADHLRPAAKQVLEIPEGHRFGFQQPKARIGLVPCGDRHRQQNHSGHAPIGRSFYSTEGLRISIVASNEVVRIALRRGLVLARYSLQLCNTRMNPASQPDLRARISPLRVEQH